MQRGFWWAINTLGVCHTAHCTLHTAYCICLTGFSNQLLWGYCMKGGDLIGILKFFRDPDKLQALEDGVFYCNSPEYYRHSGDEGVSDFHESCNHAYRKARGDKPVKLYMEGQEIEGLTALTIHNRGVKDKWLHCWFALRVPSNDQEMESLSEDINRMREEFGDEYAFVQADNINELAERVSSVTEHQVDRGNVRYSDDRMDWTVACKSQSYCYQREFRFVVGECKHDCLEPLVLQYHGGFSDILSKSPSLRFMDEEDEHVWFHLDNRQCYCNTSK